MSRSPSNRLEGERSRSTSRSSARRPAPADERRVSFPPLPLEDVVPYDPAVPVVDMVRRAEEAPPPAGSAPGIWRDQRDRNSMRRRGKGRGKAAKGKPTVDAATTGASDQVKGKSRGKNNEKGKAKNKGKRKNGSKGGGKARVKGKTKDKGKQKVPFWQRQQAGRGAHRSGKGGRA